MATGSDKGNRDVQGNGEVQSVRRALLLMEAVGRAREIGVSELAAEVGLAVSTVHSLVKTLAAHNYLISDNGRYRLGPSVTVLSSQWDPVPSLVPLLRPVIEEVNRVTGHAVTGRVMVGREAHTVGFMPATGPVTVSVGPAVFHSPLEVATGRLMVAMGAEDLWPQFVATAREDDPKISEERWINGLRQTRRTGLVIKQPKSARDQGALAVPVWGRNGAVVCSFGCSAPGFIIEELFTQKTVDAMWDATVKLSDQLGCKEVPLPRPQLPAPRQKDRT